MDPIELKNQTDEILEADGQKKFNRVVAVAVALVAVFLALFQIKGGNIVQAMTVAQNRELDEWNQYQAKSIKQNLFERQLEHWELTLETLTQPSANSRAIIQRTTRWRADIDRYQLEKTELKKAAESSRAEYEALSQRDDQFDFAEALLGLAIALFATCSLLQSRPLFGLAVGVSFFGFIMGLAGFFSWNIRPGFLSFLT